MQAVKNFLLWLYTAYVAVIFVGLMLIHLPFFLLSALLLGTRANLWVSTTLMLSWFGLFHLLVFIPYRVRNKQLVAGARPCVFVGNHTSFLDVTTVKQALGYGFLPLGKAEQARMPFIGWIYKPNVILIDRSSEASRKASMERMRAFLASGYSILIFPEGTMNRTPYLLKSFYDGAFRLAIDAQVPIVPFVTTNVRKLMVRGSLRMRPGRCETIFAAPIPTTGLTEADVPALKRKTFDVMWALMEQHAPADTIGLHGPKPEIDPAKKTSDILA
jgi:1-acyl-sn-glycerol-3-phosphate acyltransferase